MRTKQILIVVACLLALFVITSLTSSTIIPYTPDNLFPREYVYEGLDLHSKFKKIAPEISKTTKKQIDQNTIAVKKLQSNWATSGTKQIGSTFSGAVILNKKQEKKENKDNNDKNKKQGFDNMLVSSSYPINNDKLDYFSQLSSGIKCNSSPFSNSTGYICLDAKATQLLTTRGGNMSDKQGFENMLSSASSSFPINNDKLDYFSQLSSGIKCDKSPYSNSKGYICLDAKATQLLTTRGGNMSDKQDSQIG